MPTFLLALLSFPPMAAQFTATRMGLEAGLTTWDITMLRYGAAAIGSLLVLCDGRRRAAMFAHAGRFLAVGLLGGVAYGAIFIFATGMMPASHSTLFAPSSTIICTLLAAGLVLGVWPSATRLVGVGVIVLGLFVFARAAGAHFDIQAAGGDALFVLIGMMWGLFSVLARKWNLDPLCCVAAMGLTGIPGLLAWYAFAPSGLGSATQWAAVGEAVFQGWLMTFVAFLAYVMLVQRLGPATAALGIATVPPLGVVFAVLVLGETAHRGQWIGALIVVVGFVISAGLNLSSIKQAVGIPAPR
jgi:drug/metabolite transporter (DMT)-like permease